MMREFLSFILIIIGIAFIASSLSPPTKQIICPNTNCGYKGPAKAKPRGSTFIGLFLCLFFLLPGLIYFTFKSGYRYSCPKCGLQIAADN
jgi:hypothetical protein